MVLLMLVIGLMMMNDNADKHAGDHHDDDNHNDDNDDE